ncbi:MAG: ferritin-like metal-binding protein YciE [Psychromonas sp.]
MAIQFGIQEINPNFYVTKIDVFLLEKVAVIASVPRGLSKEAMTDLSEFGNKVLEMANTNKKR